MNPYRTGACLLLAALPLMAAPQQITIIDTGSTNRRGATIVCHPDASAEIHPRKAAESRQIKLPAALWDQLAHDVQAAVPLADLPAGHCAKSVSFGSRLFIEVDGDRSPDISCANQSDVRVQALKKDSDSILQAIKPDAVN